MTLSGTERDVMDIMERITMDADICGGRPCIRGLRIRVRDIVELVASGESREAILHDYPYLEAADVEAALRIENAIESGESLIEIQ